MRIVGGDQIDIGRKFTVRRRRRLGSRIERSSGGMDTENWFFRRQFGKEK